MGENEELMIRLIKGELAGDDFKKIVTLFDGKSSKQRNEFLNKLGINAVNDPNLNPSISADKISDQALHSLVKGLLVYQAKNLVEDNTFLRRDDGYLGLTKKLISEEGKRNPHSNGIIPDVIVDHFKEVLEVAPKALSTSLDKDDKMGDIARIISFNAYGTQRISNLDNENLEKKLEKDFKLDLSKVSPSVISSGGAVNDQEALANSLLDSLQTVKTQSVQVDNQLTDQEKALMAKVASDNANRQGRNQPTGEKVDIIKPIKTALSSIAEVAESFKVSVSEAIDSVKEQTKKLEIFKANMDKVTDPENQFIGAIKTLKTKIGNSITQTIEDSKIQEVKLENIQKTLTNAFNNAKPNLDKVKTEIQSAITAMIKEAKQMETKLKTIQTAIVNTIEYISNPLANEPKMKRAMQKFANNLQASKSTSSKNTKPHLPAKPAIGM